MRRAITPDKLKELKDKLKARRTELTDKEVAALAPAPASTRYDVGDPGLAGFGVRINDRGQGTFVLVTRYPGSTNPARREIGKVGVVSLADARAKVRLVLRSATLVTTRSGNALDRTRRRERKFSER